MTQGRLPADQADGLRRLFAGSGTRFLAVAANPQVAFAGLALERLAAACLALRRGPVLVVDAHGAPASEMARVDLAACLQPLGPQLHYLAARGLPLAHVDARGSCAAFLDRLTEAAPEAATIVVHADASELGRLFARRASHDDVRPLLLAADHPASVTAAYANLKLLALRHGLRTFDLLLVAPAGAARTERIGAQLAATADRFVDAVLHAWAVVDPTDLQALSPALERLVRAQLDLAPPRAAPDRVMHA
jgi:hypothetical protein